MNQLHFLPSLQNSVWKFTYSKEFLKFNIHVFFKWYDSSLIVAEVWNIN